MFSRIKIRLLRVLPDHCADHLAYSGYYDLKALLANSTYPPPKQSCHCNIILLRQIIHSYTLNFIWSSLGEPLVIVYVNWPIYKVIGGHMLSLVQVTRLMASSQHCRNQLALEIVRLRNWAGAVFERRRCMQLVTKSFITVFNAIWYAMLIVPKHFIHI